MSKVGFIYALVDPRTGEVRYIGQTIATLAERLRGHLAGPTNTNTRAWFSELRVLGLKPAIAPLEVVEVNELNKAEKAWIKRYESDGAALLNSKPGNPKGVSTSKRGPTRAITISLKRSTWQALEAIAKAEYRSVPQQIEYFFKEWLAEQQ